jgi:molybdate transport system substrate-binding protein
MTLRPGRRTALLAAVFALIVGCAGISEKTSAPRAAAPSGAIATREIVLMTSGGFAAVSDELKPSFERSSGYKVKTVYGSSMGGASDSIPARLERGEPVDVVVLARPALDQLVAQGKVVPGSQVDLVHSLIGLSVRKGAPKPDISTVEAFKRALLDAPSIAYSASASGVYYETVLLKKLGIEEQVKPKSKRILSERVATVVARGEAVMGLQQVSELLPIEGADFVGPIPKELQQVTVFAAGISSTAKQPEAAKQLVRYFTSPAAAPTIRNGGLEPAPQP